MGLVTDFHALRHTYISRVVRTGATAKAAQILARHSTVQLTIARYAHTDLYDLTAAVEALPCLFPADQKHEPMAATGTDGNAPKNLGPNLGLQPVISGDFVRQTETERRLGVHGPSAPEGPEKPMDSDVSKGVPKERLELSPTCVDRILNPARLPFRHFGPG